MFSFPSRNQRSIINCKEKQTDVGVNPCAAYTTFISKVCISFPLQAIGTNCCSSPLLSQPLSYLLSLRAADELNTHTHTIRTCNINFIFIDPLHQAKFSRLISVFPHIPTLNGLRFITPYQTYPHNTISPPANCNPFNRTVEHPFLPDTSYSLSCTPEVRSSTLCMAECCTMRLTVFHLQIAGPRMCNEY